MSRSRKHQGKPGRPRGPKNMHTVNIQGYVFPKWAVMMVKAGLPLPKNFMAPQWINFIRNNSK